MLYRADEEVCSQTETWDALDAFLSSNVELGGFPNTLMVIIRKCRVTFKHVFFALHLYRKSIDSYALEKPLQRDRNSGFQDLKLSTKADTLDGCIDNKFVLFVISLAISSKFIDDNMCANLCWSELCSIPCSTITNGEIHILNLLKWNLRPERDEVADICREFDRFAHSVILMDPHKETFQLKREILRCMHSALKCLGF